MPKFFQFEPRIERTDVVRVHKASVGRGHKGLYGTINNSFHFQADLALASLGVTTTLIA